MSRQSQQYRFYSQRETTARKCLRCDRIFRSSGAHHRLCNLCNEKNKSVFLPHEVVIPASHKDVTSDAY
jgi:hypothetical protein